MPAKTTSLPTVAVVCALLWRNDSILLAKRPEGKRLGGLWEFPGGKVEPEETPAQTLHREIMEELGCEVEILAEHPPVTHDYPWCRVLMTPFSCRLKTGAPDPRPLDHSELVWEQWGKLGRYDLCPADLPLLRTVTPPRL
jgi:8-oxo-dGTP diphosphatase